MKRGASINSESILEIGSEIVQTIILLLFSSKRFFLRKCLNTYICLKK